MIVIAFVGLACASPIITKRDALVSQYGEPILEPQAFFVAPAAVIQKADALGQDYGLPIPPATLIQPHPEVFASPIAVAEPQKQIAFEAPISTDPIPEYGLPPPIAAPLPEAVTPAEEYGPPPTESIIPPPAPVLPELPALPEIIIPDITGSLGTSETTPPPTTTLPPPPPTTTLPPPPPTTSTTLPPPPPTTTTTLPPPTGQYAPAGPVSHYGDPINTFKSWK